MANIPIKKLRDFTKDGKQIVTTSEGSDTTALYPLSVLQSVLTNETYTVKNIFCGSYAKGTVIPVKTSLHTILTNLLSDSISNVLTTDDINSTEIPTEPSNVKVPSTSLLKLEVDKLNTRIDENIRSYSAGTAAETGLTLSTENVFSHATTTPAKNTNALRLFSYNNTGHVTNSSEITKDDLGRLTVMSQLTGEVTLAKVNSIVTAHNNLITMYNILVKKLFPDIT